VVRQDQLIPANPKLRECQRSQLLLALQCFQVNRLVRVNQTFL